MGKYFLLALFLIVSAVQLYVPASMIFGREKVLAQGAAYKFRIAPVDPNDPMRGKYMVLSFEDNFIDLSEDSELAPGDPIFVHLSKDSDGFARINGLSIDRPTEVGDFLLASVGTVINNEGSKRIYVDYPFDRYYVQEYKAPKAEKLYRERSRNNGNISWALVRILEGEAALEDVMIDGVSIQELLQSEANL
jgi:uncharacterized membrane-anchored protein